MADATATVTAGATVTIPLTATDPDGQTLSLRVVSPAGEGAAWIDGRNAYYSASSGFVGSDRFTFAARDGMTDSNLGQVTVTVGQASCTLECSSTVPETAPVESDVRFVGQAVATGCPSAATITWGFGDGAVGVGTDVTHAYAASGRYDWSMTATVRTFNADPTGTYGQFFPAVDGADGLTSSRPGILPHLKRDADSRTNVGLLNLADQPASVRVTVFGATGQQLGEPISRTVPARQWVQINDVIGRTGDTTETLAWATVEVTSSGTSVWAYASVISNDSGDPITVPVITPQ